MIALLMLPLAMAPAPAPVVMDDGHAVRAIVAVQPFALTKPYTYEWTAERPPVDHGLILVLDVDPAWLVPSDTHQPVLYADALPVEHINTGWPGGRLVVVLPGDVKLSSALFYFGGDELPERVDRVWGDAVLAIARQRGFKPLPTPQALPSVTLADRDALTTLATSFLTPRAP